MSKLNIAVISDLHIGVGSRAKDFSPISSEVNGIDDGFKDKFLEFLIDQKITADILLVPGDLTHTGKHSEARFGVELLKEISAILSVDEENIFVIPGNHDVDWHVLKDLPEEEFNHKKDYRYEPIKNAIKELPGLITKKDFTLYKDSYFEIWDTGEAIILGVNSTYEDFPDTSPHYGRFLRDSFSKINDELSKLDIEDKIKICLTHHHPISYADAIPHIDFSTMQDAELLFELLFDNSFDFLIHGHKHIPKFKTEKQNSSKTINILCAGSFSAFLDTKLSGYVNNQFHLIEIHEKSLPSTDLKGLIRSWAFKSYHGWVESSQSLGIEHILPFGNEIHPEELLKLLRSEITSRLSGKDLVKLSDIISDKEFLKYVPKKALMNTLTKLESELNFEVHENGNKIFILKLEL